MKFSTMANTAGGGQQVPGFIGVGKAYITSRKFISAEGGIRRIVWMPKDLKEFLREDLDKAGKAVGIENFTDLIADETNGTDVASVQAFMQKVNHPALTMWDITTPSEEAAAVDAARLGRVAKVAAAGSWRNYRNVRHCSRGCRAAGGIAHHHRSAFGCRHHGARRATAGSRTACSRNAGTARRWRRRTDRHAGAAAPCSSDHRNSAGDDAHAADGGPASLHRHAPAACRRQHAADAIRHAGCRGACTCSGGGSVHATCRRCPTCFPNTTPSRRSGSVTVPMGGVAPGLRSDARRNDGKVAAKSRERADHLGGHRYAEVGYDRSGQSQCCGSHRHPGRQRHPHFGRHHRRRRGSALPPLRRQCRPQASDCHGSAGQPPEVLS